MRPPHAKTNYSISGQHGLSCPRFHSHILFPSYIVIAHSIRTSHHSVC